MKFLGGLIIWCGMTLVFFAWGIDLVSLPGDHFSFFNFTLGTSRLLWFGTFTGLMFMVAGVLIYDDGVRHDQLD